MREIKFRAWNGKGMIVSGRTDLKYYIEASTGRVCWLEQYEDDNWGIASTNKWVLMQYTGLKDKNGVEIWEGDVVKLYAATRKRAVSRHTVFWYGNGWNISAKGIYEVIGNIYENPELLTPSNNKPVEEAELKARLVELDLLEQYINRHFDAGNPFIVKLEQEYKLMRLEDLKQRLAQLRPKTDKDSSNETK